MFYLLLFLCVLYMCLLHNKIYIYINVDGPAGSSCHSRSKHMDHVTQFSSEPNKRLCPRSTMSFSSIAFCVCFFFLLYFQHWNDLKSDTLCRSPFYHFTVTIWSIRIIIVCVCVFWLEILRCVRFILHTVCLVLCDYLFVSCSFVGLVFCARPLLSTDTQFIFFSSLYLSICLISHYITFCCCFCFEYIQFYLFTSCSSRLIVWCLS